MLEDLIKLLEYRGVKTYIPVDLKELHLCVLENLTVKDLLSISDGKGLFLVIEKMNNNFPNMCRIALDMWGDREKVSSISEVFDLSVKDFMFNYMISPAQSDVNKLIIFYLDLIDKLFR